MSADLINQPTSTPTAGLDAGAGPDAGAAAPDLAERTDTGAGSAGSSAASGAASDSGTTSGSGLDERTGAGAQPAADEIKNIRERIDEIDGTIIDLWLERSRLSQQVGRTRMASGGTRLVLSREREIVERFREALGPDGTQVALLLLRAGRGPL